MLRMQAFENGPHSWRFKASVTRAGLAIRRGVSDSLILACLKHAMGMLDGGEKFLLPQEDSDIYIGLSFAVSLTEKDLALADKSETALGSRFVFLVSEALR